MPATYAKQHLHTLIQRLATIEPGECKRALIQELDEAIAAVIDAAAMHPPIQLVVVLDGGSLQAIITDSPHIPRIGVINYVSESAPPALERIDVPQTNGNTAPADAYLMVPGHDPKWTTEVTTAIYHGTTSHTKH